MAPHFTAELALSQLQNPSNVQALIDTLDFQSTSSARSNQVACALAGNLRFADTEISLAAKKSGQAAALLMAWDKYGAEMLQHIGGAFALAVVDAGAGSVLLAVDRFSVQTLCYCLDGDNLSFSDRADCVAGRGEEIDPQALFDYLYFHVIPAPRTIFSKVKRVPAAHALLIDASGVNEFRHSPLDFDERYREPFSVAKESFRSLIRESVAEEIEGHVQVGAFLSGGTDSSTVCGMLGQITGAPTKAYSIGFEAEGYDEMEYARLAARHFGCDHHEYYVTPADLSASLPDVARHHDQPFGNSSALPAYYCAKMAKSDGCTKMLAGDGGDELFGGNSRYAAQRFFDYYHRVPAGLQRLIEPMCGDESILRRIPGLRQATGYVRHSRQPMPERMQSFNLIKHLDPAKVLSAELLVRIDADEPTRHMRGTWNECKAPSLINRMLAYDWRYTLADSDLPKVRGATDMAGIAVGYPLLSDRITDFSMRLAPEWKLKGFKLRWFFKEALRGYLPDEIITKKKKGFGLPFGVWAARDPALRKLAEESLQGLVERRILREDFARRLVAEYLPEHPGYYGEMVWILIILEQWLRVEAPEFRM